VANPSELCARASQSPANMSRISDALVSRDLITRVLSAHDRRRMVLRITEQGEELVRRLLPIMFVPLRTLFADFPEPAQRQLLAQLKQLYANFAQLQKQELLERDA
jgi:MarR family transcriptional regulator, negative regulator of the multidrug operon emrRAB